MASMQKCGPNRYGDCVVDQGVVSENGFHLLLYCVTTQAVLEPAYDDGDTDEEEEATRP